MNQTQDHPVTSTDGFGGWQQMMQMFDRMRRLPEEQRKHFLDRECDDPELRGRLTRMMASLEQTESFIDRPLLSRLQTDLNWQASDWLDQGLAGYQLTELIAQGGMGLVFKARQEKPAPRDVAIKMIRPDAPVAFIDRFRMEQTVLARLNHPNIASIYNIGITDSGQPFLVMEHVDGLPLVPHCNQHKLNIRSRLELLIKVCDGIAFSHQRGVLHRDIKSSNVLVRRLDNVDIPKIIDFGIATELGDQENADSELTLGTPEYMSPEHLGSAADMDVRADVYSVGMLMFNLLVGKAPFDLKSFAEKDLEARCRMINDFRPPAPSQYFSDLGSEGQVRLAKQSGQKIPSLQQQLSIELDWICSKALRKDPEQRYQSINELSADLRRYLSHQPLLAAPDSPVYRVKKFVRRHRLISAGCTLLVALVVAFTVTLSGQYQRAEAQRKIAEQQRDVAEKVTELMTGIFSTADPYLTESDQPEDINGFLERGLNQIQQDLSLDPEVRTALLLNLIRVHGNLGDYEKAISIAESLLQEASWSDVSQQISTLIAASFFSSRQYLSDQAIDYAQQALTLASENRVEPEKLAEAQRQMGIAYLYAEQFGAAEPTFRTALSQYTALNGNHDIAVAQIQNELGYILDNLGRYEEAERFLRQSLATNEQLLAADHPEIATVAQNLASVLSTLEQHQEATGLIERAYKIKSQVLGSDHPDTLIALGSLALAYFRDSQLNKGLSTTESAIELSIQLHGEQSRTYVRLMNIKGAILDGQKRFDEALIVRQKTFETAKQFLPENDFLVGLTSYNLASNYARVKQWAAGIEQVDYTYGLFHDLYQGQHVISAYSLILKAKMQIGLNHYSEAEANAAKAVALLAEMLPENHWRKTLAVATRAYAHLKQNRNSAELAVLRSSHSDLGKLGEVRSIEYDLVGQWLQDIDQPE